MTKKFLSLEKLTEYDTLIKDKINSVNTIEVSETEPTGENVAVWLNPSSEDTINIPEINDSTTSLIDTWSSQKINSELASAGKVKTVNGIEPDENGNIKISVSGGTSTGGVTSWNDLIDKPFEDNVDGREVVAEKQSLTLNKTDVCVGDTSVEFHYIQYINENPLGIPFNDGDKLIYIWNGVEYECTTTCIYDEVEKLDIYKIGNENIVDSRVEDTGVPFFIAMMKAETMYMFQISSRLENASLEIQKAVKTVKYLDNKYIKDMYGSKNIINEYMSLQDITFEPHVDQGNIYGWSEYMHLLTETYEDVNEGETILVTWDGNVYECEVIFFSGVKCLGNIDLMTSGVDNGMPFIIILDFTGMIAGTPAIGFMNCHDAEPSDVNETITHSISIRMQKEEIAYIKPKYIKDMYYTDGYSYTPVLNSTSYNFTYDEADQWYAASLPALDLDVNKTYRVIFDGNPMIASWQPAGSSNGVIDYMLTAGSLWIFFPSSDSSYAVSLTDTEAQSHTIDIAEQGEEIIHHIPNKYIEDMYGSKTNEIFNGTLTTSAENGGFNLDRYAPNISLEGGKTYKVIFNGVEYNCVCQAFEGSGNLIGNMTLLDNGGTDTGEPFGYIISLAYGNAFGTKEAGTFSIEIYYEELKQIPSKYLPTDYIKELINDAITTALNTEV